MIKTLAAGLMLSACAFAALPTFAATMAATTSLSTPVLGLTAGAGSEIAPAALVASGSSKIWVDSKGMTLYTFDKDTVAGKSMCNDKCAAEWPPLMAAADATGSGDWTIVTRNDGSKMWAFKGHPLSACEDHYRSYDVNSNTYLGYDGIRHECRL